MLKIIFNLKASSDKIFVYEILALLMFIAFSSCTAQHNVQHRKADKTEHHF